ncbi:glycosyltransferase [Methanosphaera stadtmanae]|uniref:glycosyltransferase n=1 Tax=Methanosphaera stadtmanae TaxID=2317 RepID=UPI0026DB0A8C|nr:glycosyltransferase [Methanosphaera stadtmanae]MEE0489462.1 glycosyltransferase [Methanosphaera stadtmanae]
MSLLYFGDKSSKVNDTVSVVIPAFNEEKSIKHVIDTVKQVKSITEIIVVDDGSTDKTYDIVSKEDVVLIKHKINKGKGSAMKTGLKKVTNNIVLFLDADLSEINKKQVESIIRPIIKGNADITKTKFKREAGRVTELTAKPLLQFFFPELSFEQPLSGQFAATKNFLDTIDLEKDYGVDIGIVLDADARGMRIHEVDIGNIVHEMSSLKELNLMANEVVRTIVDRAINYGRLTMVDDLGSSIRMEIMGLSLITLGIFGLFFIRFMTTWMSSFIIIIGLIISILYIIKIIKMSLRIYGQSKVSKKQIFKSFIHMHFPIVISIIILLLLTVSLVGSVTISSNQISIEPASKNLIISTSPEPHKGVDVRGPYTIENALENEEQLIRLPTSALSTLQSQYGDNIYINHEKYQLEQSLEGENDLIRMPELARSNLEVNPGDVIRDSDFKTKFENTQQVKNIKVDENTLDKNLNNTTINVDINHTNASVGTEIKSQQLPEKILTVYVNDTEIGKVLASVTNTSYSIYLNEGYSDTIDLNSNTHGVIYNQTYKNSTIEVVLEDSGANTTTEFANDDSYVKFLNINIDNVTINNTTTTTQKD